MGYKATYKITNRTNGDMIGEGNMIIEPFELEHLITEEQVRGGYSSNELNKLFLTKSNAERELEKIKNENK